MAKFNKAFKGCKWICKTLIKYYNILYIGLGNLFTLKFT